jgi:hypothetical protein
MGSLVVVGVGGFVWPVEAGRELFCCGRGVV